MVLKPVSKLHRWWPIDQPNNVWNILDQFEFSSLVQNWVGKGNHFSLNILTYTWSVLQLTLMLNVISDKNSERLTSTLAMRLPRGRLKRSLDLDQKDHIIEFKMIMIQIKKIWITTGLIWSRPKRFGSPLNDHDPDQTDLDHN